MNAMTRRDVLQGIAAGVTAVWPAWLPRLAFAPPQTNPRGDVLLVLFLRGAADALNIIVPHGDDAYYRARPSIAIARPDHTSVSGDGRVIDLDGFFGFHPALRPLLAPWQAGHLGIIHACGAPDDSRSHFKAMALMERTKQRTVPQIFINDQHVGGFDDLYALDRLGQSPPGQL